MTTTEEQMATKKKTAKKVTTTSAKKGAGSDVPNLFRINVELGNLDQAAEFYGKLFGIVGRKQAGSRCYFECGSVTSCVTCHQSHTSRA